MKEKKKMSLVKQIFVALVLAVIAGLLMQDYADFAEAYIRPVGTIFLNLIKFIVCPIVLFSIMGGILSMRDIRKLGAIGFKALLYFTFTTAIALVIGLAIANLCKGFFPTLSSAQISFEAPATISWKDTLIGVFPSNIITPFANADMLQIIVIAILFGVSIVLVGEKANGVIAAVDMLTEILMKCMDLILKLSPIGIFCLLSPVIARNGAAVIGSLAIVILVVYVCYVLHCIIVYSLMVKTFSKVNPLTFFKKLLPMMMMGFSSGSSVGALPLNFECC